MFIILFSYIALLRIDRYSTCSLLYVHILH